ncbi:MAG: class I SAM-dependent methyltransferase, partial [Deltaproteobacteria bacterium]|nr:class I SAM-dependent methyltransferase [Deltaproteobacteria bacterium]
MTTLNHPVQSVDGKISGKRSILDKFFSSVRGPAFAVDFWDGKHKVYGEGEPEFTVVFLKEPRLLDLLASPSLFFGEEYMRGDIDITGSFRSVARALDAAFDSGVASLKNKVVSKAFTSLSSAARTLTRQKKDIASHYDIGNDFFSLWLDEPTMSYSCAYFRDDADSLSEAQRQKIDLVLRKLQIRPGMRMLDIGCGWGGLSIGAARDHGAKVLAITLSEEQAAAVRQRYDENGLNGVCEVRLCNYLELEPAEPFDRVVSVGMFEHVGKEYYGSYFDKISSLLRSGGLYLLHTLTKNKPGETDPWIAKRIFPGGRIPAITEVIEQLPEHDFHLIHAESLRRHYVKTLDAWYENFSRPEVLVKVRSMFDQAFIRMCGLYLR